MGIVEGLVGALDKVGARGGGRLVRDTVQAGAYSNRAKAGFMESFSKDFPNASDSLRSKALGMASESGRSRASAQFGNVDMGRSIADHVWGNLNTEAPNLLGKRVLAGVGAAGAVGLGVSTVNNFSNGNIGSGVLGAVALTIGTAVALASPDAVARGLENKYVGMAVDKTLSMKSRMGSSWAAFNNS